MEINNYDALDLLEASLNLKLKDEERWENLTLANDFLFGKVFQDPELFTGDAVRTPGLHRIFFYAAQRKSIADLGQKHIQLIRT